MSVFVTVDERRKKKDRVGGEKKNVVVCSKLCYCCE